MKKILMSVFAAGAIISAVGAASAQQIYLDFGPNPGYGPPPPGYGYGPPPPGYGSSRLRSRLRRARSVLSQLRGWWTRVLPARPIPNLERMPARLDCTGRPLQALSRLLAGLLPS
jgi:hypothetical protein